MSSKPPSRRASSSSRSGKASTPRDDDFLLDCKAAYLTIYDALTDHITTKSDLQLVLQQTGRNPTQKSIDQHWVYDTKRLTFDDFCAICRKEKVTSEDDLLRAFQKIDLNGDGFISHDELYKMMTQKGEKMSKDEVQCMINEVDENKDGKLDYKEFGKLVMSTTNEVKQLARLKLNKMDLSTKASPAQSARASRTSLTNGSPRSLRGEENGEMEGLNGSMNGSHKPVPRPRSATRRSSSSPTPTDDAPRPQPRSRRSDERPRSPVASKRTRLPEPRSLDEWRCMTRKGVLHLDDVGQIVSHKYRLTLTEDADVWITIQAKPLHTDADRNKAPIDAALLVLNDSTQKVIGMSELRDNTSGKYCMRCDLSRGKYLLLPFSTGCRLRRRTSEPKSTSKLVKKEGDSYVLSKAFREALLEIFDMIDIDVNGLLSREEFNLFNLRTSGEQVADAEWEVVEENIDLKDGQITVKGFVQLSEMEAEDNEGDTADLWVTLNSMGFNKTLIVDEACPFTLNVFVEEDSGATLDVLGFTHNKQVEAALTEIIMAKGDAVKLSKEVSVYVYSTDYSTSMVAENKSRSKQVVNVDLSRSVNCITNKGSANAILTVQASSTSNLLHVMPQNERQEWTVRMSESLA